MHLMSTPRQAQAEQDCFRALFDKAAVGLRYTAPGGRLLAVNEALANMLGYASPEAMISSGPLARLSFDAADLEDLRRQVREHGEVTGFDVPMRRQDGRIIWVSITINNLGSDNVVTVIDVTDQRQHEEASRANESRLRSVLATSSENYFILDKHGDVQRLSSEPESNLGYETTALLSRQAHLVHPDDRSSFTDVIRRLFLGESEFEVTRYRGKHKDGSWRYLEARVTNMLRDPDVEGLVINVRDITDQRSAEEKLEYTEMHDALTDLPNQRYLDRWIDEHAEGEASSDAATALHQAKARGRNRFQLFTGSMQHRLAVRLKLEGQLRRAVEAPEGITQLRLLFDPLVSLRDRNTVGMEALVAWQHREQGLLRAAEFVPLAEEMGLSSAIDHWVLGEACQTARRVNRGRRDDPLFMSVNLSGHELNNPDIVTWVTKEIARADIDPTRLWLEITETV